MYVNSDLGKRFTEAANTIIRVFNSCVMIISKVCTDYTN